MNNMTKAQIDQHLMILKACQSLSGVDTRTQDKWQEGVDNLLDEKLKLDISECLGKNMTT